MSANALPLETESTLPSPNQVSEQRLGSIMALGTVLLWSSAFAGIRAGLDGYGPLALALFRFGVASLAFGIYACIYRIPLPRRDDLWKIALVGWIGITLYHTCLNMGEQTVTAGLASMIIAIVPVFTALLSRWFLHERLRPLGWLGLVVSLGGVALISLSRMGSGSPLSGMLLVLTSAVAGATYMLGQKPLLSRYQPIHLIAYLTWAATIPMLAFAPELFREIPHAPASATWAAIYMGIFPAASAYTLWSIACHKLTISQAGSFLYLNPLLAVIIGWLWRGEQPQWLDLVGGLIALAGVWIVNRWGRTQD